MKYTPIELSKKYIESTLPEDNLDMSPYGAIVKFALEHYGCDINMNEEELEIALVDLVCKKHIGEPDKAEQIKSFVETVVKQIREELSDTSSLTNSDFANSLLIPLVFSEWQKNKIVYKMENETIELVQSIVSPVIDVKKLDGMDSVFWIDFEGNGNGLSGALVKVVKTEQDVAVIAWSFDSNDETHYYSHFSGFSITGENEIAVECKSSNSIDASFFIDFLSFLQSDYVLMEESELTRKTYRERKATSPVKNKFSEVRIFDVSYSEDN